MGGLKTASNYLHKVLKMEKFLFLLQETLCKKNITENTGKDTWDRVKKPT